MAQWKSGWRYRIKITIPSTYIDTADLEWFPLPLLVNSTSGTGDTDIATTVFGEIGASYLKMAVTKDDGVTELYVEKEKWTLDGTVADSDGVLWVSLDGWKIKYNATTTIYLYYDSAHADNTAKVGEINSTPGAAVWDDNHLAVYHMKDGASTSAIYDSTSNSEDGTKSGAGAPGTTSGIVGFAQDFDRASSEDIDIGNLGTTDTLTIEAQARIDTWVSDVNFGVVGSQSWAAGKFLFGFNSQALSSPNHQFQFDAYSELSPKSTKVNIGINAWYNIAGTYDKTGTSQKLYIDGALDKTITSGQTWYTVSLTDLDIGDFLSGRYFPGKIDEVRISNVVRTAEWLKANYYAQDDNLISWGSEEIGFVPQVTMF